MPKVPKQTEAKRDGVINPQNYNFNQFNTENFDAQKKYQTKQRAQIKKIPKAEYMSTDEESDDGLISHPPSWQSDTFARIKNLDSTYLEAK